MTTAVAIIGTAFRFPTTDGEGGLRAEAFWEALREGRDLVTQVAADRWSQEAYLHPDKHHPGTSYTFAAGSLGRIDGFDASFFGISPREAAQMDPQQRMLLELTWEAMEDAGIPPESLRGSQCGVYMGIASLDYSYRMSDDMAAVSSSTATGNASSLAANRISYAFDLRGPSMSMDTACSSSMVAFHQACQAIRSGEVDAALAGGISLHLHPYGFIAFSKATMLSPRGRCRVFDASGDGYVRSEGGGIFLLKSYDKALADGDRVLAVVAASGVNTDGHKHALTVPTGQSQVALMSRTLARAGLSADDLDYLEAHGTGTAVGDPIETHAIGTALGRKRRRPLPIGSVKSNVGHLETASGVAGLAKAIAIIRHREIPPTIGIDTLNPRIDFAGLNVEVVTRSRALEGPGRITVGINSFGFGGANAHVILQSPLSDATPTEVAPVVALPQPLPIRVSARSPQALRAMATRLADSLAATPHSLYDVAHALFHKRDHHRYGALCFATALPEAINHLLALGRGDDAMTLGERLDAPSGPVFVYSGNGCQWLGMGRALLKTSSLFSAAIDEVDRLFSPLARHSLRECLESDDEARLSLTEIAQPTLFAIQVGLTRLLREQGVMPTAVVGHSVGEVAAAWASGALTLGDAIKVIYWRSRHQGYTRGAGGMTAVGAGVETIQRWLDQPRFSRIALAGINSPRGVTLAGPTDDLEALETALADQRLASRRLPLDYAFHSAAMEPIREGVLRELASLQPQPSTIPFYSTVTGDLLEGRHLGAEYWWQNIRQPVSFAPAIDALSDSANVFVEIGAHPILGRYIKDVLQSHAREGLVLSTMSRDSADLASLTRALSGVLLSGVALPLSRWFPVTAGFISLPSYPWQRESHWYCPTPTSQGLMSRHYAHPLLGYPLAQQRLTWESQLDIHRLPWLRDHRVGDGVVFPGAGFVELALAAVTAWREAPLVDLESLEIRAPLLLDGTHGKRLRLTIDDVSGDIDMIARDSDGEGDWTHHATARALEQSRGLLLTTHSPALPSRTPDFTRDRHLAAADALGLNYGPAFQAIGSGWIDGNAAIGRIELTEALTTSQADCLLAPGILDSAFQLFIPLLAAGRRVISTEIAFVPVRLERVQWRATGTPPAIVRLQLTGEAPHSLCADVALFDAAGNAIAVVQGARFRAARLRQPPRQRLSYLRHRLVPAALHRSPLPLDDTLGDALADAWQQHFRQATGCRYGREVDPLIDSLIMTALSEALTPLVNEHGILPLGWLETGSSERRQQRRRLLTLAHHGGLVVEEADAGWRLHADSEGVEARTIWNLLIRDYPEHAGLIHRIGRQTLHLAALMRTDTDFALPRLSAEQHAGLIHDAIGEPGWQSLADTLLGQCRDLLALLPASQRVDILELSAWRPQFGSRLPHDWPDDRARYRFVALGDAAIGAGESLTERYPARESLSLAAETGDAQEDAQFVLLALDAPQATVAQTLERLAPRLAEDATLMIVGLAPSSWQHLLSITQPATELPCSLPQVEQLLTAFGYRDTRHIDLDDDGGIQVLLVRPPQAAACDVMADRDTQHAMPATVEPDQASIGESADIEDWLLVFGRHEAALARQLNAALTQRGARVRLSSQDDRDAPSLSMKVTADHVVDLRGLAHGSAGERCRHVMHWLQQLEADHSRTALHVITRGVARQLEEIPAASRLAAAGSAPATPCEDSALWGFGRVLQNEAGERRITLIDLPLPAMPKERLASTGVEATQQVVEALVDTLLHPDAEQELVIDAEGGRWAPRLVTTAAPEVTMPPRGENEALSLGFDLPGQLRHLRWQRRTLPPMGPGKIKIQVAATGLNFRDVMYALGLLSDEAIEHGFAGATLGLEFAGRVVDAGDSDTYRAGDRVVGFGPASFSDYLVADTDAVAPIPDGIDFAAAATLPTTFFTVYYALKHLARLAPGERLLIHGAAGGVGLAAVQVGRWLGAEIFATAGNDDKRDFLRLMGVDSLYDSRSLTFAEEILHDTGPNGGVDVVLNSLAGEAINQNLRALKPFGRFIELGKRDFYENTAIGLRPYRNNLSYFGVDSDQLMRERPDLTRQLFREMMALFADGTLTPLPYIAFDNQRIIEAFRYMQQARQIGKVVVTYAQPPVEDTPRRDPRTLALDPDASYLITGGLGGFGLATARWLTQHGARHLLLLSRRGPAHEESISAVAELRAQGIEVRALACDVSDKIALADALATCDSANAPLKGVIHAATAIDDTLVRNLDAERLSQALAAKIEGARHLDALTRGQSLDFFVLYSSVTTQFGNPGQASYVAANHWLEGLVAARRANGLPATCLRWGAIGDVGFLARHPQIREALMQRLGGSTLDAAEALQVLEQAITHGAATVGVMELAWHALSRFLPTAASGRYRELARLARGKETHDGEKDFRQQLAGLDADAMQARIVALLRRELSRILMLEEERIDLHRPVYDMGFDSLMGVELVTALESKLGIQIPVMILSDNATLNKLGQYLVGKLQNEETSTETLSTDMPLTSLAQRHGIDDHDTPARRLEADA
ncbi:type I polyketide synthase [Salinicola avicenniae]|uniref:type I polyketide synthase n=1 Tax=Salinicola avicenniae TaxID=2916836 RepID=UPI0020730360|nr:MULTISPECIES: type I polyketide synthase [unclassified Salinicola]